MVELHDRIELVPVAEDPVEGLRDAVGDAFEGKPIEEIKREARETARDEAVPEER